MDGGHSRNCCAGLPLLPRANRRKRQEPCARKVRRGGLGEWLTGTRSGGQNIAWGSFGTQVSHLPSYTKLHVWNILSCSEFWPSCFYEWTPVLWYFYSLFTHPPAGHLLLPGMPRTVTGSPEPWAGTGRSQTLTLAWCLGIVGRWGGRSLATTRRWGSCTSCSCSPQFVWAATREVGCGVVVSRPRGSYTFHYLVCDYFPPGNVNNKAVYRWAPHTTYYAGFTFFILMVLLFCQILNDVINAGLVRPVASVRKEQFVRMDFVLLCNVELFTFIWNNTKYLVKLCVLIIIVSQAYQKLSKTNHKWAHDARKRPRSDEVGSPFPAFLIVSVAICVLGNMVSRPFFIWPFVLLLVILIIAHIACLHYINTHKAALVISTQVEINRISADFPSPYFGVSSTQVSLVCWR